MRPSGVMVVIQKNQISPLCWCHKDMGAMRAPQPQGSAGVKDMGAMRAPHPQGSAGVKDMGAMRAPHPQGSAGVTKTWAL